MTGRTLAAFADIQDPNQLAVQYTLIATESDIEKLQALEKYFRRNVMEFEYTSAAVQDIKISEDKYFSTVNSFDLKFDTSASDHIRGSCAYTVALYET